MKKTLCIWLVFFYVCTFAAPRPAHAVVPLAVIGAAAVGASMLAASTGAYYAQTGAVPSYVSATASAVASAADHMFYPAYLAKGAYNVVTAASFPAAQQFYLAKSAALGASMGDIWNAVKNGAAGSWSALRSLFEANTFDAVGDGSTMTEGVTSLWDVNPKGYVFANGSSHYTVGPAGYWQFHTTNPGYVTPATADALITGTKVAISFTSVSGENSYPTTGWIALGLRSGTLRLFMFVQNTYMPSGYGTLVYWYGACTSTDNPESFPALPGEPNYAALKEALTNPGADVSNDIKDVIKTLPPAVVTPVTSVPGTVDTAEPSPTLTQAEIDNWFRQNTAQVAQAAADAAAAAAAADPTNAALQAAAAQAAVTAAQAAADAAEEPATEEETFSAISDSAFDEAYNPGEYDIPARFTSFLNNVKSSGLFSFSSSFFNSLPGGGSPTYTIEAGRYGTHAIDLSQTLSVGLAVLKSILLACFGFLSIRAVIMKR